MRVFNKISYNQFEKDVISDIDLYNSYKMPQRSTENSAGYDFFSIMDYVIKPCESKKISLSIKACLNCDEVLFLIVRSSMGFKYNIRMCNQIGVIDSDYYDNIDNEGHIWIKLQNEGEKDYTIKKGDKIIQGIFLKYLLVDNEKEVKNKRVSGIGSTNKEG